MDPENTQYIKIDEYPENQRRIETGVVQFNDDWPGIFIRGDNALYYGTMLHSFLKNRNEEDWITQSVLENLCNQLMECAVRPNK